MKPDRLLKEAKRHYDDKGLRNIRAALVFATKAHSGQKRLSGEDYINHPIEVAEILVDWQMDADSVVAGILHDTLEDTKATKNDIEEKFGKDIAFLVDSVSKVGDVRSGMRPLSSYLPQTSDNLTKLLIATSKDLRVILIKLADRLHNLRTLQYLPPERQRKVAEESLVVFAPLADRLGIGQLRGEIESIAFSYLEPKTYLRLNKLVKKRLGSSNKYFEKIRRDVSKALEYEHIEYKLDGRIKSVYSLYKKLQKVGSIDNTYDLLALRIIVKDKAECYRVLGVIHSLYKPMVAKIKDYISVPKPNGYQSLHTTVITPYEHMVEFQIRSVDMHEFAERGLAASFHYNQHKLTKQYKLRQASKLPRNLRWISELQEKVQAYLDNPTDKDDLSIELFQDRIFAHSPNGDIYDLAEGATALDYAFAVHSDVGEQAMGAKINGKMCKLSDSLTNGDVVEIITAKNIHPTAGWLDFVKTEKARTRIRSYLASKDQL